MDQRVIIDIVCKSAMENLDNEIGALLGQELVCSDIQLKLTSRENLFSDLGRQKTALTRMTIEGDRAGNCYLLTPITTAARLGGTLIMLPEDIIRKSVQSEKLDGDLEDAFSEVANIIAGVFTQAFISKYKHKIRFIKKTIEELIPTKIDLTSNQPFASGNYYIASCNIGLGGEDLGPLEFVIPAAIFDLEETLVEMATEDQQQEDVTTAIPQPGEETAIPPIILLISDQKNDANPFIEILTSAGYKCQVLTFQDEVKELFQKHQILGIFLIMAQVGEKGFATAIKLQAAGRPLPPIIFAGRDWTRSAVLRAIKYGAKDIMVMPVNGNEIQDKITRHIKKAS